MIEANIGRQHRRIGGSQRGKELAALRYQRSVHFGDVNGHGWAFTPFPTPIALGEGRFATGLAAAIELKARLSTLKLAMRIDLRLLARKLATIAVKARWSALRLAAVEVKARYFVGRRAIVA